MDGVCGSQDRRPRIESGMDSRLRNRNCLLLHSLVDSRLVFWVHFVELVDATNSVVSQHQGTSFDAKLSCLSVLAHTCRETGCCACFARSVNGPRQEATNVLQELTLCSGWVAYDADVDVATKLDSVVGLLRNSSEELQ